MVSWKRVLLVCWFGCFVIAAGMNLVLPFIPLYVEQLGVHDIAEIEIWSGITFGAPYLVCAFATPLWGALTDRFGRKPMLLRASLGMAIIMTLQGFVGDVYQFLGLRLLMGAVSGYVSAAITVVATQTPKDSSGWALGTLSSGTIGGTLLGPLIGGALVEIIGMRHVYIVTGALIFVAFIVTLLFIQENHKPTNKAILSNRQVWEAVTDRRLIWAMFFSNFILTAANLTIEPVVTVYVNELQEDAGHLAMIAGAVVSSSGIATFLFAPYFGKLSDRIGPRAVLLGGLVAAAIFYVPQAFVKDPWQLIGVRFLAGAALAGLPPAINSIVRRNVPDYVAGRIFGYNHSAFYIGSISGPTLGGMIAAHLGIPYVFFATSALLFVNAVWVYLMSDPSRSILCQEQEENLSL
ncbi:MFS transporter [Heliobacterium gestii]|uniref:MFS transporter n=1 Tax=Heliomicrobium gestii TaxID=2699 RepID=A0A845L7W7_HELGE|nr:multidrug efflux MFS transporter [Heliomicrobium gestii]MBM7865952.1 MFS family permease [Heliomicrobium gestii]MZP42712.1 MFS transporter [Heliomicrobium gestii]